ncbi:acetyl-CoA C-acetyltransferase [Bacilli bacterium PM5-3]|nr:acetyl-CoA C-acetyltransferase [Bacilli bacterium PM5-3]MDH6603669.1 acetyl-CoA C-acetyltransferase [Bacilli bacterium PM5-9]
MNVYIVDAKRTAIGSLGKSLSKVHVADLGASVVAELVKKHNIKSEDIDEVISGNALPAAAGQGVGRQVAIKSGLAESVCGHTVSMVCGSGVKSINNAFGLIKGEEAKLIIAGGTENMSLAPYAIPGARAGLRLGDTTAVDTLVFDALTDAYNGIHMGVTAENVAKRCGITREMQDEFSLESQQKALNAIEKGYFKDEIVPITIKNRRQEIIFDTDEHPKETSLEKLANLAPVFEKDGTVTAGNASGINDGAAYAIIANDEMVEKYNFKPMAKIIACAQAGIDPKVMGLGPAYAIKKLLAKTDLTIDDIDIFELNEAFAAQSLGVAKEMSKMFNVDEKSILDKTNYCGGAIALGHPVGASGARIITTLVHQMKRLNKKYGIASLCIGGGMGIAILVENTEK